MNTIAMAAKTPINIVDGEVLLAVALASVASSARVVAAKSVRDRRKSDMAV